MISAMTEPCCSTVLGGELAESDAAELAAVFKVLSDPGRVRLLSMIAAAPNGEACACDLIGPIGRSQPTVSHHLSQLVEAGLLIRERRGKWAWFKVDRERINSVRDALLPTEATR